MKRILIASIVALLLVFMAGCKGKDQPAANPNDTNTTSGNPNGGNPTTAPGSPQQPGATQPGAAQTTDPTSNANMAASSMTSEISMMAMDFHSSLLQGDKARLEPMLADDYKRTRADGTVVNKTQELASLKKVDDLLSMESQPAQINGDTATVTGKISLTAKDMSGQKKGSLQTTDTFKKRNNKWVVVSSIEKKG